MKKVITLLVAIIALFSISSFAQPGTICNAGFNFTVNGSNNTVQFVPTTINTSALLHHQWIFGDGTGGSDLANPSHSYAAAGSYYVTHIVTYRSPNDSNLVQCYDSIGRLVSIAGLPACNIHADFSFVRDSIQTNKVYFSNLSTGSNPNTIVKWYFGDGTFSNDANPTHSYQTSGAYSVCLAVRRDSLCADDTCKIVQVQVPNNTCNLQVNFNSQVDSSNNLLVHFFNQSTPLASSDSIQWLFGDGSFSTALNPSHTYNQGGIYTVCLLIQRNTPGTVPCVREYCQAITLVGTPPPACNIHSNFSFVRDSIPTNIVHFTNLATGTDPNSVVKWYFGDGTFSYDLNPTHTYQTSGAFTVCLAVRRDSLCADDTCKVVQVSNNTCNLQAYFTSEADSSNPLQVHFFNQSAPMASGDSVRWTFGDGSSSTGYYPSHTYAQGGTYNVCVIVTRNVPGTVPCIREYCHSIIVQQQTTCNLVAGFVFYRDSIPGTTLSTYRFENTSTPLSSIDSSFWDFGDGSPIVINPNNPLTHTYAQPGTYIVCLKVKKVLAGSTTVVCERQVCHTIVITTPPPCNFSINFDWRQDSVNRRKVIFTNTSQAVSSGAQWNFGDGSSSYGWNADHIYDRPGQYLVCLKITVNNTCIKDTCKLIWVSDSTNVCNLQVNYSSIADSNDSHTIHFFNQTSPSASGDSLYWTFGDGSFSTSINPTHTYNQGGWYPVCLTVERNTSAGAAPCVRQLCNTIFVQQDCNLTPGFTFYSDTINAGNSAVYHFTNTTTPLNSADSVLWYFGDGSPVVVNNNFPVHTFPGAGVYTVCISVKQRVAGTVNFCVKQRCETIVVTGPPPACNLDVNFSWHPDSVSRHTIYFNNLTTAQPSNAIATWNFGDGSGSYNWNPDHIYTQPGQYTVCLKVTLNNACIKDTCKVITVLPTQQDSCNNLAVSFTTHPDSANSRKLYFTNTTPVSSAAVTAHWSFGDGIAGNGWNADHTYAQPGWYVVCLTVTTGNNCTRVSCDSVFVQGGIVPPLNCDSIHLGYVYRRDGYMSNKLYFFATSSRPTLQQQWTFTRLADNSTITVNERDPVHVFSDTGRYRVCVRASYWGGCVKEYCNTIKINRTTVPSQCILQAYPNPAHSNVSVNLQLQQPGLITASIFNSQSILLRQYTQQGFVGNNLVTLNIQTLAPGFYTVRLMYGGRVCYTRFQKF